MNKLSVRLLVIALFLFQIGWAQEKESEQVSEDETSENPVQYPVSEYKPLKIDLDESGSKYIRFIVWAQIQAQSPNFNAESQKWFQDMTLALRRLRFLAYAQVSERFLILTHFGVNNATMGNLTPTGQQGNDPSLTNHLFFHDVWGEFKVLDELSIGAGLHYWNGLSRMTQSSTLNFMTLDNFRQAWAQLGVTDQFARPIGIYAKGNIDRLNYMFSLNQSLVNNLQNRPGAEAAITNNQAVYRGAAELGSAAAWHGSGYVEYQFWDKESNKLPYRVGSYLGKKRVFNIGAGFFAHPNGAVIDNSEDPANPEIEGENVFHFAADAYLDMPVGEGAINAYGAFYNFNYGENLAIGQTYTTGQAVYAHLGYLLPRFSSKGRFMPYGIVEYRTADAYEIGENQPINANTDLDDVNQNQSNTLGIGANWFFEGHNAKLTWEFRSRRPFIAGDDIPSRENNMVLQLHIFL